MSRQTEYGAPDSTRTTTVVTGARSSVAPPPSADGLAPASCIHERASGRLRLAEACLLRETVCDTCGSVLQVFPPLTYRMPLITPPPPATEVVA
jgi:hypothetical protein